MTIRNWGPVRDCMRTNVTEVDGSIDVLSGIEDHEEGWRDQPDRQASRRA